MNPFLILLLATGGAFGLSRLAQAVEKQRQRKTKRKLKPKGNPLCGAYWVLCKAVQPFQTKGGWTFAIFDSAGREDEWLKEQVNKGLERYSTKTKALQSAWDTVALELDHSMAFHDVVWEEPVPPHIRVFTLEPVQLPPEVDKQFCTNPETNQYWVSDECDIIVEGAGFEPYSQGSGFIGEEEAPTLNEVLAIQGNSVYGYIATLFSQTDNAGELAYLVWQAMPYNACLATELVERYVQDLARRISPWVVEQGGIPLEVE